MYYQRNNGKINDESEKTQETINRPTKRRPFVLTHLFNILQHRLMSEMTRDGFSLGPRH